MSVELLQKQLDGLIADQKAFFEKAKEESASLGKITTETKTAFDALQKQVDAIDAKIVEKTVNNPDTKSFDDEMKENESVQRLLKDRKGHAVIQISAKHTAELLQRKTTITSAALGTATGGVINIERMPGIVEEARETLRVRDVLSARPTSLPVIYYVKVDSPMTRTSSPQTEGAVKHENAVTFAVESERVRTLATWIPAAKQALEDFEELMGFLQTSLPYYVNLEEELQILSGDGTGENLSGLTNEATSFDAALHVAAHGWNKIDQLGRAIQQVQGAKELPPTFAIVHTNDWWDMRLTKDEEGRYILGDPWTSTVGRRLFDQITLVPTTSITDGTFLVGSGNSVATEIRDRTGMTVEISTEHSDYFTKNMVAIRAEKRLALVTRRPASFITGTFTTSPAS